MIPHTKTHMYSKLALMTWAPILWGFRCLEVLGVFEFRLAGYRTGVSGCW